MAQEGASGVGWRWDLLLGGVSAVLVGCTVLHGLADMSLLSRQTSFGLADMFREHPLVLLDHFCDFVTGGLVAPTTVPQQPSAHAA